MIKKTEIIKCLLLLPVFGLGHLANAKEMVLRKIKSQVEIKNSTSGLRFELTGANTYLSCRTKYSEGFGESGSMVPLIYDAGINVNNGFPLKSTVNSKAKKLDIKDNFNLIFLLKAEYAGTQYSVVDGKQMPYCKIKLYQDVDQREVAAGFMYLDLPASFCTVPK